MPDAARPDLAALIVPLGRALTAAELPVLARHQLSMWGYVVLLGLDDEPVRTQAALAKSIGADKTRIIGVLDELQSRGLLERTPAPTDRRVNLVSLTEAGRALRRRVQGEIQAQENRLLDRLPPADRQAFLRSLHILCSLVAEQSDT